MMKFRNKEIMTKKYVIKSDRKSNPTLKKQIVGLRSGILGQCDKVFLPQRFTLKMSKKEPGGTITDNKTGRTTTHIPLFALSEIKATLSELFG
jgi:hypothetical protein